MKPDGTAQHLAALIDDQEKRCMRAAGAEQALDDFRKEFGTCVTVSKDEAAAIDVVRKVLRLAYKYEYSALENMRNRLEVKSLREEVKSLKAQLAKHNKGEV